MGARVFGLGFGSGDGLCGGVSAHDHSSVIVLFDPCAEELTGRAMHGPRQPADGSTKPRGQRVTNLGGTRMVQLPRRGSARCNLPRHHPENVVVIGSIAVPGRDGGVGIDVQANVRVKE